MMGSRRLLGKLIVVGIAILSFADVASAIPAFARKYKTSCGTCHEAFPRLNAVGEAFRLNGYKFADDDLYIKDEPVELGDESYKRVWPKAIWPADIPGMPPLAIIFNSTMQIDTGGTRSSGTDFLFPDTAKIIGAGAIGEDVSFFFELGFDRSGGAAGHGGHGASATSGTVTSLEGWLQLEDIFGPENFFNVQIGTVGMQEMGMFNARNHNRLTLTPYLYSSWTMPAPSHHFHEAMGLVEDGAEFEGNPFSVHAQPGVQVNGFGRTWRYVVGVVNGNGDEFNDNNSEKDVFAQVAYKIGGLGFDGSGTDTEDGELTSAESWRDNSVIISGFVYFGTANVEIEGVDEDTDEEVSFTSKDRFCRVGAAVQWKHDDLAVRGGGMYGNNDNPYGALTSKSVSSCAWFAEAEYFVFPWLVPYVRYEGLSLQLPNGVEGIDDTQDRNRVIVGAKVLIRANISLNVEGRFHTLDQRSETDDGDLVLIALKAAF